LIEKNMGKYIKSISLVTLVLVVGLVNLAIAAAPSGPIEKTQEGIYGFSSVSAESIIEQGYKKIVTVTITAYSSTVDQTDSTPFITAANTKTRDGVVAANFLPFYTKIKIPELFGDKIFVVEDRMNRRFNDRVDIWFPDRESAKKFGKKVVSVQVF
jgi:3D (Asp-Asp-Asp) domain-containing protein